MPHIPSVFARLALCSLPLLLVGCAEPRVQPQTQGSATAETPARTLARVDRTGAAAPVVQVYKTPTCGCCGDWVIHVEQAGFKTEVHDLRNLTEVKSQAGVPRHLESCHTTLVGGYVVEGHVPADAIARLLREQPDVAGIAVPGMPMGSPGMEGPWKDPYDVIAFRRDGSQYVFESR